MSGVSESKEVPSGTLLQLANNILETLGQETRLEDEEGLFSDEFYITIVSNIVPEESCNFNIGETIEEKVESLKELINFLAVIVEIKLDHISAKGIITQQDAVSAKHLLELIYELIMIIKQDFDEGGEAEEQERYSQSDSHRQSQLTNIEHSDLLGKTEDILEKDNLDENEESAINEEELRIDDYYGPSEEQEYSEKHAGYQDDTNQQEMSESYQLENKSFPIDDKDLRMINKPDYYKNNYSQNDLSRFEKELAYLAYNQEMMEENEQSEPSNQVNHFQFNDQDNSQPSKSINVSHISEASKSKEISEPHSHQKFYKSHSQSKANNMRSSETLSNKERSGEDYRQEVRYEIGDKKPGERYMEVIDSEQLNEDIERVSELQGDETPLEEERPSNYESKSSYVSKVDRKGLSSYNDKDKSIKGSEPSYTGQTQKSEAKEIEQYESSNIQEGSQSTNRVLKKNPSEKQLLNKKKSQKSSASKSKSEISQSSYQPSKRTSRTELTENLVEELPVDEENLKYEIMKEFRRLYGNKLDKIFLKSNLQKSSNQIELALRNIRLARSKMMKLGQQDAEPDDLITKEFLLKYSREFDYILNFYKDEEKKRNNLKKRAVNSIAKNQGHIKRLQQIETKKIDKEIERRKESRKVRQRHNDVKICNQIYNKALILEREKYLEERKLQAEIRRKENEKKRNEMINIENYYKDKISLLRELLRREKYEKEIEYRAKLQFISKFEREKKASFKKQIDQIFNRFEEEDRRDDFLNNNNDQIETLLHTFYKKK